MMKGMKILNLEIEGLKRDHKRIENENNESKNEILMLRSELEEMKIINDNLQKRIQNNEEENTIYCEAIPLDQEQTTLSNNELINESSYNLGIKYWNYSKSMPTDLENKNEM